MKHSHRERRQPSVRVRSVRDKIYALGILVVEFPIDARLLDWALSEASVVKVRDATLAELAAPPVTRELTPRQRAIRLRHQIIAKALKELATAPASVVKRVELDEGENLQTIRASIAKQIREEGSAVKVKVRNGGIFLSSGPLPGGRGTPA